jgi:nucleotide-binding universal stress UspA family protein
MFKHILIATDGSPRSQRAIEGGIELAKCLGAVVTGVTAVDPYPYATLSKYGSLTPEAYQRYATSESAARLKTIERAAHAAGVACTTVAKEHAQPHQAILQLVGELGCDAVVMASHGRHGLQAMLLGSETQKVLAQSPVPVLVYR